MLIDIRLDEICHLTSDTSEAISKLLKRDILLRSRYQLAAFAGIDSTCVSVLSGTSRPIDTGFVVCPYYAYSWPSIR